MQIDNKLNIIRETFNFDDRVLASILDIEEKELHVKSEKLKKNILDYCDFRDDGFIIIQKKIDASKYKNIFEIYSKTLKEYFDITWEIFVVAKIKLNKRKFGVFNIFFSKEKNKNDEINTFYPTYLACCENKNVLISFYNDHFTLVELGSVADEKRFVFDDYRYVRANKIELYNN